MLFFAALFVLQFLMHQIGFRAGRHHGMREGQPESVGIVVSALLGLQSFVLALTLSFASAHFAERRTGTLNEANAIGTARLRAEALSAAPAADIARLLQEYARVRGEATTAPNDSAILGRITDQTNSLQQRIWERFIALMAQQPTPPTVSLETALNAVFDATTAQRYAGTYPYPKELVVLLIGLALIGMGALGFLLGVRATPLRGLSALLIAAWSLVIVAILDIGAPRAGLIRTNAAPFEWLIGETPAAP